MKQYLTIILLFICLSVQSQSIPKNPNKTDKNGWRQGKWTSFFTFRWEEINDKEKAFFYRIIEYVNDKPVGNYQNYYITGELQLEGKLIQDRPKNIFDGKITWYRRDGSVFLTNTFDKGRFVSQTEYDENGDVLKNYQNLKNWGMSEYQKGNYAKAVEWLEKAVVQLNEEPENKKKYYASALYNLGLSYYRLGQFSEAKNRYTNAIDFLEKNGDKENQTYLGLLNNLAAIYYDLGNFDKAEPLFIESKNLKKRLLGKEHPKYATALSNLATIYQEQELYTKATRLYEEALEIQEEQFGADYYQNALTLNNLAILYSSQGLYSIAENTCNKALKIQKNYQGEDHPEYANTLSTLLQIYIAQSHYADAEAIGNKILNILEKAIGKNHLDYASSLELVASIYKIQGQDTKAEELMTEVLKIKKDNLGGENTDYATSLAFMASIYGVQGDFSKAEQLLKEALSIEERVNGKYSTNYAYSLSILSGLYKSQGLLTKAEPLSIEVVEIYKNSSDDSSYANSILRLASLYVDLGKNAKAEKLLLEAKEIYRRIFGQDDYSYSMVSSRLAKLYFIQGLYDKAEPMFFESVDISLEHILKNFSQLSEKEKGVFLSQYEWYFQFFYSFAVRRMDQNPAVIEKVYQIIMTTKGLLFEAQQKVKQRVLSSGDSELIGLFEEWKKQCTYLSKLYQLTKNHRERDGIDIDHEINLANDLEKKLSAKSQLFSKSSQIKSYNWRDVQSQLSSNEAAIEIVRFNYVQNDWTKTAQYLAMIITAKTEGQPEVLVLENGNDLESKFLKYYKNNIKFKLDDRESYGNYWEQIQQKLGGIEKVYLSADGAYHSISLEGLFNAKTGVYLGDELDIQLVSSTRDLVTESRKRFPEDKIELMGFPDYNNGNILNEQIDVNQNRALSKILTDERSARFFDGQNIPILPGTQKEISTMQNIMNKANLQASVYLSEEATESNVKSWSNPKIAHIATHGYFLKDTDIAKEKSKIAGISKDAFVENPLLRSGLLLTNAKQAIQNGGDGVLTAYEAQNLNLDETELVVLSACETGLGDVQNGEGVYGLQRAFQTAGAASVLMSLWTVSDNATQELMTSFYENWLINKQGKRQAFKNAQKSLREKYPHPYYWAAFVLAGE